MPGPSLAAQNGTLASDLASPSTDPRARAWFQVPEASWQNLTRTALGPEVCLSASTSGKACNQPDLPEPALNGARDEAAGGRVQAFATTYKVWK